jgi:hypothetical protein
MILLHPDGPRAQTLHELTHVLRQLTSSVSAGSLGHRRGGTSGASGLLRRSPIEVSPAAFEVRISGREHSADVIR